MFEHGGPCHHDLFQDGIKAHYSIVVSLPFSSSDYYTVMEPFIAVRGVTTLFAL